MQNNVIRILTFLHLLQRHTDEKHPLTRLQLSEMMEEKGFSLNRKTLYEYVKQLNEVGYQIVVKKSGDYGYYLTNKPFSFAQAKLLVDAVQTSRVLEKETSVQLISNIASLMSQYESAQLKRKLYMSERPKTFNKNIYDLIDKIHGAIQDNRQLSFRYFDWTLNHRNEKEKCYRHDGKEYIVSPYSLVWAEDSYYMVAHYSEYSGLSNFRVDRMDLLVVLKEKRVALSAATNQADFNLAKYSQRLFSMFVGEVNEVVLLVDEDLLSVMIDRFSNHATYTRKNNKIEVKVSLEVSPPFLAWVFQFNNKVKIMAPTTLKKMFKKHTESVYLQYQED